MCPEIEVVVDNPVLAEDLQKILQMETQSLLLD